MDNSEQSLGERKPGSFNYKTEFGKLQTSWRGDPNNRPPAYGGMQPAGPRASNSNTGVDVPEAAPPLPPPSPEPVLPKKMVKKDRDPSHRGEEIPMTFTTDDSLPTQINVVQPNDVEKAAVANGGRSPGASLEDGSRKSVTFSGSTKQLNIMQRVGTSARRLMGAGGNDDYDDYGDNDSGGGGGGGGGRNGDLDKYQSERSVQEFNEFEDGTYMECIQGLFKISKMTFEDRDYIEDMEEELIFGEDAYSLLGVVPVFSKAAAFAWFVIFLQGGMLFLTLLDLVDFSSEPFESNGSVNRMGIPAGASYFVTASQFLGFLLTCMVMAAEGDLVLGTQQLLKGYDDRIKMKSPNTNFWKWLMTGFFQAAMGGLLLLDSFILSMKSTTVIDLALNLTALHFLQEFDEKAFEIATETGLLGDDIARDCELVSNVTHWTTPRQRKRYVIWKRIIIFIMLVGLLGPYFMIVTWQSNGRFMCDALYVQFGDAFFPEMALYSGIFISQGNNFNARRNGKPVYVDGTNTFQIGWCPAEDAWTISKVIEGPCDYIFKSPDTDTYDINQLTNVDWVLATEYSGDVQADWLKIKCNDCSEETCEPKFGTCSEAKDECICNYSYFGVNCQFQEKCMWFALDQRTRQGLAQIPGSDPLITKEYVSVSYQRNDTTFYDRPLYIPMDEKTFEAKEDVESFIIFTGRRWVVYAIPDGRKATLVEEYGKPSNWTSEQFFNDFRRYYEATNAFRTDMETNYVKGLQTLQSELINYFPIFMSTPVDYAEDSDNVDISTVNWMSIAELNAEDLPQENLLPARPDTNQQFGAKFICSDCETGEVCMNGGVCEMESGECICPTFYDGFMCERVKDCMEAGGCNDRGVCDPVTGTCSCDEGNFGSLCQLGENRLEDVFLCPNCALHGQGECLAGTFGRTCTCQPGFYGIYCNETLV